MKADHVVVADPKDTITGAPEKMKLLQNTLDATYMVQAFDSMVQVTMGETAKKEDKKQLIINIITALLIIVPLVASDATLGLYGIVGHTVHPILDFSCLPTSEIIRFRDSPEG
ncbi:chitinase [Penicillium alfredii]|uniref:Chitinase n=1 Tax=Penicillium alfredii TaxID=1506179 RepID=A0A9W9EHB7_9EURO|nr:chitinase [Penicillium alfredii]KAJ5081837.1 chitinase [Penicillium alfredii]